MWKRVITFSQRIAYITRVLLTLGEDIFHDLRGALVMMVQPAQHGDGNHLMREF
jgi:hypothetical protein